MRDPCEKYVTSIVRPLLGVESLRIQGLFFTESDPRMDGFNDAFLKDLAGNAFEASCYTASLWSGLIFLARVHAMPTNAPGRSLTIRDSDSEDST